MLRVTTILAGASVAGGGFNQLYFEGSGGADASVANELVRNFWTDIAALGNATNSATVQGDVEEVDIASGNIVDVHGTVTETIPFFNTGEILPQSLQVLCRLRTGQFVNGRELRGRIFLPGMSEAQSTAGTVLPGLVTAVNSALNELAPEIGIKVGVYSRTHGVFALAGSRSCWDKFAVLRSRRD